MKRLCFVLILALGLASCEPQMIDNAPIGTTNAYVPVYAQFTDLQDISVTTVQPTTKAGKIYAFGNYVFQNDRNKGIHIIDNSVASTPKKVAFIKIPYSTEIAIKGNYLYTNSVSDLLVFDLQDPLHPTLAKRLANAFPVIDQHYPPVSGTFFVCPDPEKGIVVDWNIQSVVNPSCRR